MRNTISTNFTISLNCEKSNIYKKKRIKITLSISNFFMVELVFSLNSKGISHSAQVTQLLNELDPLDCSLTQSIYLICCVFSYTQSNVETGSNVFNILHSSTIQLWDSSFAGLNHRRTLSVHLLNDRKIHSSFINQFGCQCSRLKTCLTFFFRFIFHLCTVFPNPNSWRTFYIFYFSSSWTEQWSESIWLVRVSKYLSHLL